MKNNDCTCRYCNAMKAAQLKRNFKDSLILCAIVLIGAMVYGFTFLPK